MTTKTRRLSTILAMTMAASLSMTACGSDDEPDTSADTTEDSGDMADDSDDATDESADDSTADAMGGPVGPSCDDYAAAVPDGPGSMEGMAQDPVATAASNNPMLTTLVAAVSGGLNPDVDLVDTLNSDEFTVFAPVDDAFAAVDEETVTMLSQDADLLTTVLTYHVVPGQLSPDDVVGELTTVQGEAVTVSGDPENLTVNDAAVICGGVETANATVYLIDGVLLPPM